MPSSFRYRYVDLATVFTGDAGLRSLQGAAESPGTLFANELAVAVGGMCWGSNEPLPVLDHHFSGRGQFPSSSAALLHTAEALRERFAAPRNGVVWLVTHKQPNFDAFCAMFLARWTIETPAINWQPYGLHPNGWIDPPDRGKIDWLNPDLAQVPQEQRWPLLLAGYSSMLSSRHHISCSRARALHSLLYAALKRGRDYLSETSGATEFFDEVRTTLLEKQLNPAFDSVLEGSDRFAPELEMLDREADAYERDLHRARPSIVYLPESEAPSASFFKSPKEVARLQMQGATAEIDEENLRLADTFRLPADGIFLRDPECALFTEWARLDVEHSSLGAGFEFTAIAGSNGRPGVSVNSANYTFSLDPDRANGRQLYTVWSRLESEEVAVLNQAEQRAGSASALLADPWLCGQEDLGTIVTTPQRGTAIGRPGTRSDLRDDPVAEAVRTELEGVIYAAQSLVTGPQITAWDFGRARDVADPAPRQFDFNHPQEILPPGENLLRFASIGLRPDVPIASGAAAPQLAHQIGETLWQVLYPESPGSAPPDFAERHLVLSPDWVGVWSNRGVAIAAKPANVVVQADSRTSLHDDFVAIVSLMRDVDQLAADWKLAATTRPTDSKSVRAITAAGEELAHRALKLTHDLTLPDRELLRRFSDALGLGQLLDALRDVTQAAGEHLRRHELVAQQNQAEQRSGSMARLHGKLAWIEVFIVAFLAIEIIDLVTRYAGLRNLVNDALVLLGGPVFALLTAWILKPWRRKQFETERAGDRASWFLVVVVVACVAAWAVGLLRFWNP